jgi:hypothetical protein
VPLLDVRDAEGSVRRAAALTTNGTPAANGAENVPDTLAACAGAVLELARRWDALEAALVPRGGADVPEPLPAETPDLAPALVQDAPAIPVRPQAAPGLARVRVERGARPGPGLVRGRLRGRPLDDVAWKTRVR